MVDEHFLFCLDSAYVDAIVIMPACLQLAPNAQSVMQSRFLLLLLALSSASLPASRAIADASDNWKRHVAMERQAERFIRTKQELSLFETECSWLAKPWRDVHYLHDSLETVLVFDVRHGHLPGMGALQERLSALLRVARSIKRCARSQLPCFLPLESRAYEKSVPDTIPVPFRAGFIWSDHCADHNGPKRQANGSFPTSGACLFDQARAP